MWIKYGIWGKESLNQEDLAKIGITDKINECDMRCRGGSLNINCTCEVNKELRNKILKTLREMEILHKYKVEYYYAVISQDLSVLYKEYKDHL
jgi:hypothetical protein